ncbi:peptidoglycan D,D-transpeptidase FtsI family protein [Hominifimenecus sp. rT4P-3]|uniref:peptidoglycan D,D-transpeptidase FtsI family protein n=1 Tax=Hominifimenecus sp. rT4P-3 TaxID=3242979 RepID=UPI003DA4A9D4
MRNIQKQSLKEEGRSRKKINREIVLVTYVFVGLFLIMIGYLGYFTYKESDTYRNNPYNSKRQQLFSDRYIRGTILSSDGKVLAKTEVDEDGKESRNYPYGPMFAHVVGYSTKGNTGIESIANSYLLNTHINPALQILYELKEQKTLGDTVKTTLDTRLQRAAYEALGDAKGAVVAMDPKTGAILAMVSKPDYDPNEINAIWDELVSEENKNSNLVNRASQGLYPPGSTFKILTLLEYIRENPGNYEDFSFDCDSVYEVGEYKIRCSKQISHGEEDLITAFAKSCNGAFSSIGQTLNFSEMYKLCEKFGYNAALPTDLLSNASSFVLKDGSSVWDVLQTSIGQGKTTITPLHNAMIAAAVANQGVMVKPYVLESVESESGTLIKRFSSENYRTVMSPEEAAVLQKYMRAVVTDGTGSKAEGDGYRVAGKTGSAEFASGRETHAWFVGYADVEDPKIVVSVLVEEGGSGGSTAAPIAKAVFDAYYGE